MPIIASSNSNAPSAIHLDLSPQRTLLLKDRNHCFLAESTISVWKKTPSLNNECLQICWRHQNFLLFIFCSVSNIVVYTTDKFLHNWHRCQMCIDLKVTKILSFQHIRRESSKHDFTTLEASKAENRDLNRYRDVYPYDHSRVKLENCKETDYINASLVKVGSESLVWKYQGVWDGLVNLVISTEWEAHR